MIKNTGNPTALGTIIDGNKASESKELQVKGIANLDNLAMFNVSGPGLQGVVGMASRIFSAMLVQVILINSLLLNTVSAFVSQLKR